MTDDQRRERDEVLEAMRQLGLSQRALSRKTGIAADTIGDYLKNACASRPATIYTIRAAVGLPADPNAQAPVMPGAHPERPAA